MFLLLRLVLSWIINVVKLSWTYSDPRTAHLPMIANPVPLVLILGTYLYFANVWGPRFMKDRKAYDLRHVMITYNAVQVVLSVYIAKRGFDLGWNGEYNYFCQPLSTEVNEKTISDGVTVYMYFLLKVVDLMDTVFMVLRRNFRQVTFLHLYHHTGMVFAAWYGAKVHPGGHPTFLGVQNCIVHCVMYGYYMLCSIDTRYKEAWWKQYITLLQIIQFGINLLHESLPFFQPDCQVVRYILGLLIAQNLFMFVMFSDFYWKTYVQKSVKHSKAS